MASSKTFESVRHHWWPAALSAYWVDCKDEVSLLMPDGETQSSAPRGFGYDKHSHNLRFGAPWNSSFEGDYFAADNAMGSIVDWLVTLEAKREPGAATFSERLLAQSMTAWQRATVSSCLASLIVRSPLMRHRVTEMVTAIRERFANPFPDNIETPAGYQTTIAYHVRSLLQPFENRMRAAGKYCLLISGDRELIFGDGFFNTFPPSGNVASPLKCIVPLTPTLAMLYTSASRSTLARTLSAPSLATLMLPSCEVEFLNALVQVYACQRIFYRCERPAIKDVFVARRHLALDLDRQPWLDGLFAAVADYTG